MKEHLARVGALASHSFDSQTEVSDEAEDQQYSVLRSNLYLCVPVKLKYHCRLHNIKQVKRSMSGNIS